MITPLLWTRVGTNTSGGRARLFYIRLPSGRVLGLGWVTRMAGVPRLFSRGVVIFRQPGFVDTTEMTTWSIWRIRIGLSK